MISVLKIFHLSSNLFSCDYSAIPIKEKGHVTRYNVLSVNYLQFLTRAKVISFFFFPYSIFSKIFNTDFFTEPISPAISKKKYFKSFDFDQTDPSSAFCLHMTADQRSANKIAHT